MTVSRLQTLINTLKDHEPGAVAFSGGVDSTLLLALAVKAWARPPWAISFFSPLMTSEEKQQIKAIAALLGARLRIFKSRETELPEFRRNPPDRCYLCKKNRLRQARAFLEKKGIRALLDGTNADDLQDYRPGLKANREFQVVSPFALLGWTKKDIRRTSRRLGLPNWDRPSAACLASRVPYGEPLTPALLRRIAAGEEVLRQMDLPEFRLRSHGMLARIEIPISSFHRLLRGENRQRLVRELKNLGYRQVTLDLAGLRSGSMDEGLVCK